MEEAERESGLDVALQVVLIVGLGVLGQWAAWRWRLPAIVVLLALGVLGGPVLHVITPDAVFGELLAPFISLSVAIILFEGGLRLRFKELRGVERVFLLQITVGVVISWVSGALAARYLLGFSWPVAFLLGAILVVTGPTVIGPILRHLNLRGRVASLLNWEGILIDPLGATLAVLVFAVIHAETFSGRLQRGLFELGLTLASGGTVGVVAGLILIALIARYWVPDFLLNAVTLAMVFVAFELANLCQEESGLLAVTVFGIVLANQKRVATRSLLEFKETLTVLLISVLFVVLAARLQPSDLAALGWESLLFVVVMLAVARPLGVFLCSVGSPLTWQERLFLAGMAPRGIVAAAISSVVALALRNAGYEEADRIVPITFLTVFVAAVFYGLIARPLAKALRLVHPNPQGILFVGASSWVQHVAIALAEEGIAVYLVDTNWQNVARAKLANLPVLYGSALAAATRERIMFSGLGRMLAVTPNSEVNSLACLLYAEEFGWQEVYQLAFVPDKEGVYEMVPSDYRGRILFDSQLTFSSFAQMENNGYRVKKTKITAEFTYAHYREQYKTRAYPLFILKPDGKLIVITAGSNADAKTGDLLIAWVQNVSEQNAGTAQPASSAATDTT